MTKADPLVGTVLGGVQLLEKLGSGGMGSVYLGLQTALQRKVAVKILPEHLSKDAEYIARFQREATTAGRLEHPNIVSIYDIGHEGGTYFIVMQYVEGESLQAVLNVLGTLPPRDAARLVQGVLEGLQHAHEAGVIHRDVKPDNILVTPQNQPKILDFGLAIQADAHHRLTETNTVVGTPYFISPEQAKGRAPTAASDIYSAGVTLYTLLTGRVPFSGRNALAILNKHIHETPVSPVNLNSKIPVAINDIVLRMMAKRPEDRYRSAGSAAGDLAAFLDGRPPSTLRSTVPVVRERKAAWPWIVAGAASFVIALLLWKGVPASARPSPEPRPGSGAALPTPEAADPELDEARRLVEAIQREAAESGPRDVAVYPDALQRVERLAVKYANRPGSAAIVEAGRRAIRESAEAVSRGYAEDLRPRLDAAKADKDLFTARKLLLQFPPTLREICETGRGIRKELADTETAIVAQVQADLQKNVPALIEADEFEDAAARLEVLLANAPGEFRDRLVELKDRAADREAERRFQLLPRISSEVGDLEAALESVLARRRSDEAWEGVLGYLGKYPPRKLAGSIVRLGKLPIATLQAFKPSEAREEECESWLNRLEIEVPAADKSTPAARLACLCGDILRWEWVRRRADRGVARLKDAEVVLERFGRTPGKLLPAAKPGDPFTFVGPAGPVKNVSLEDLPARDVALLCCASENGAQDPVARALAEPAQSRLCYAVGVAYLYSAAPDRFAQAKRWMEKAREHGAPVPAFRLDDLAERIEMERERMAREFLRRANDLAAARKYAEAHKALEETAREHEDRDYTATLKLLVQEARSRYWFEEAQAAKGERNWTRVRQLVQKIRKDHEEYRADEVLQLYGAALLQTGTWTAVPMQTPTPTGKAWTWSGKNGGTPAPAKYDSAANAMVLAGGSPLFVEKARTEGATGFRAKLRLNQLQQSWDLALLFDAEDVIGDARRAAVRSSGKLETARRREGSWEAERAEDLPAKVKPRELYEVAVVSDGEITVVCFGEVGKVQPVYAVKRAMDPKGMLGLWSNAEASFSDVQVRDGRN